MINIEAAQELLGFGEQIVGKRRAREQLEGAVALHGMLTDHGVAYLADEVGMGKTLVALGALALFRHFDPNFRVLIIAPRENIQNKWMKEFRNFVAHKVRFPDLRVKALDGRPARPLVKCNRVLDLVHETTVDPNRDFFLRLSSFSLPLSNDPDSWKRLRKQLQNELPWFADEIFRLHDKQAFKDNFARALCCALPIFDLVIMDEGHNLKHGFKEHSAARNRVLSLAFGHPSQKLDRRLFPDYGPRARRVLFLSATPIEESYMHLWNQLDVFGRATEEFAVLRRDDAEEAEKKKAVAKILVRRVTTLQVNGKELTKNLYRREWRAGGVETHDHPINLLDARQRLVVALVQKKVSELLGDTRFNSSFQIGMLASFESFLQTARVMKGEDDEATFDDAEQTDQDLEREGIDVYAVNQLASDYRKHFNAELPHPKMDAVVASLADSWVTGRKALIFVRRIASVKELKNKLDDLYDQWLIATLRQRLPDAIRARVDQLYEGQYRQDKYRTRESSQPTNEASGAAPAKPRNADDDRGGADTFFAWFFRGEGPKGVISGANIQQRFIQRGGIYATFFEDNYVMALLDARSGEVTAALAKALGISTDALATELGERAKRFLGQAKKIPRADRFAAFQAAAVEKLKDVDGPWRERAQVIWNELFATAIKVKPASTEPELGDLLETATFWTELRQRPALRQRLWPEPGNQNNARAAFREQEQRALLLATAARLGHAFIDLYTLVVRRLESLDLGTRATEDDDETAPEKGRIEEYLDLLEDQMRARAADPESPRWSAFDELAAYADHFDLILDVNAPEAREERLTETARLFGALLRQQQPVGGMFGQVNQTLVRQFRLPGYPFVLISTDLLQEGEDLHTFCNSVMHYGISWTPSSMEQRVGRVDRVRSLTERTLSALDRDAREDEKLQVYFPHLQDTVEILQVQRVLERMNTFLRLMHEGLSVAAPEQRKIDVAREILSPRRYVPQICEKLHSAFPVPPSRLDGAIRKLRVCEIDAQKALQRFERLEQPRLGGLPISWQKPAPTGRLIGEARLGSRVQPFRLLLRSHGERLVVHCASPIGRVRPEENHFKPSGFDDVPARIAKIAGPDGAFYDLRVEEDVLLGDASVDEQRVGWLIKRVLKQADDLEQQLFKDHDEPLEAFVDELTEEETDGE